MAEEKMSRIFDKIREAKISEAEAMTIIGELKQAIENKDEGYISSVCHRINPSKSSNPCADLFSMEEVCSNISLEYKSASDDLHPSLYITPLTGLLGSCNHAYVYVDSDFDGFLDKDIEYLSKKGITDVEIINTVTGEKIYSGRLDSNPMPEVNKDKREGWFILIGVLIFIGMGILVKRCIR